MKSTTSMALCCLSLMAATAWANGHSELTPKDGVAQARQQVQALRQTAGLTPLNGPGVIIQLQDKPRAKESKDVFSPGIVHDYEILEVVNELRAANAEGIAVNGVRLTSYTAIRCKGPIIYVGGQAVNHPYKVEAVGNPEVLRKSLSIPGGVFDHLSKSGPTIRLSRATQLHLIASTTTPSFRFGKPE